MIAVVFNARDHSYRLDGVKLPSVTQILDIIVLRYNDHGVKDGTMVNDLKKVLS